MRLVPALALALAVALTRAPARSATPAADTALAYARAVGRGDYAAAYGLLARGTQRYFKSIANFASVFQAERFRASGAKAIGAVQTKSNVVVTIREDITYLNHGTQAEGRGRLVTRYVVVREARAYRVDDGGHPYRSFVPTPASRVERDGVRLTVRELAFYPRRIELTLSFENRGNAFVTFLPYGRTLLRDQYGAYHPLVTRDWLLTDRRLFLGLRLPPDGRYTGQIDFLVDGRLDDRTRDFSLSVAPALREGADEPEAFGLPQITVPAS